MSMFSDWGEKLTGTRNPGDIMAHSPTANDVAIMKHQYDMMKNASGTTAAMTGTSATSTLLYPTPTPGSIGPFTTTQLNPFPYPSQSNESTFRVRKIDNGFVVQFDTDYFCANMTEVGEYVTSRLVKIYLEKA